MVKWHRGQCYLIMYSLHICSIPRSIQRWNGKHTYTFVFWLPHVDHWHICPNTHHVYTYNSNKFLKHKFKNNAFIFSCGWGSESAMKDACYCFRGSQWGHWHTEQGLITAYNSSSKRYLHMKPACMYTYIQTDNNKIIIIFNRVASCYLKIIISIFPNTQIYKCIIP